MSLSPIQIRLKCREEYRQTHKLPKARWAAFQEHRRREDHAAVRHQLKREAYATRTTKLGKNIVVERFLRKLRRCLDKRVREVGGTEFSVLRQCFLERDVDCSGNLDVTEFMPAMASLGLFIKLEEAAEIVGKYDPSNCGAMVYEPLVEDIQRGSTHFLIHPSGSKTENEGQYDLYTPTPRARLPALVRRFILKLRKKLLSSIEKCGEYERILIRRAFLNWDADASGKLNHGEFQRAMGNLGMVLAKADIVEIFGCYDLEKSGEITYARIVEDVCRGVPHFIESTLDPTHAKEREAPATMAASAQEEALDTALVDGMFTRRRLNSISSTKDEKNALVEAFKHELRRRLVQRVRSKGGTVRSVLREAFLLWDSKASGKLNARDFRGAMARVGVAIDIEAAQHVLAYYDQSYAPSESSRERNSNQQEGEHLVEYKVLVEAFEKTVPSFMTHPSTARLKQETTMLGPPDLPASDDMTPALVRRALVRFRVDLTAQSTLPTRKKKKQMIPPRDLFHGALLRQDHERRGVVDLAGLTKVLRDLRLECDSASVKALMSWYAHDGSNNRTLPYIRLLEDTFGPSAHTTLLSTNSLPALKDLGELSSRTKLATIGAEKSLIEKRLRDLSRLQLLAMRSP